MQNVYVRAREAPLIEAAPSRDELLTVDEVCSFVGGKKKPIHPKTIYRWIREGRFPPPIKLGAATSRWKRSTVEAFIDGLWRS